MVRVVVRRRAGAIVGWEVSGHAGWARRGHDVVCAGVSAVTDTAVLGLVRRLGVPAEVDAGPGRLVCRLPEGLPPPLALRAQDVLETMCLGLRAIQRGYPGYVEVRDVEEADGGVHVAVRSAAVRPQEGRGQLPERPG